MPYFDEKKATRAVRFVEMLKLTDDFFGRPFVLMDYARDILWNVYGTMTDDGFRLIRDIYLEVPKKNAKSQLGGAIACISLFNKHEPNGQIYGVAGDIEQASIIFRQVVQMIEQEPELLRRVKINMSSRKITNLETGTFYKVISSEWRAKHGFNPSLVIFDELHVQPSRHLYDVMTRGSGLGRKQPLRYVITTAGEDPDRTSIAWEVHEKAANILAAREAGDVERDDPTWYVKIFAYDGDDIYNEANWYQANPGLGITIDIESMRILAKQAKLSKADEKAFRWLNLNQWLSTKLTTWLPLELFEQAAAREWSRAELIDLSKKQKLDCFLGIDLSSTTDLTALCLEFPAQEGLSCKRVIFDAFIPKANMEERIKRDKVPYDKWVAEGWVTATEGNSIDYNVVLERILGYAQIFNIVEAGIDKSLATWLMGQLEDNGIKCVPVPQTYEHLTEPMQAIEVDLRRAEIEVEDNPAARWCFGNVSIHTNGNAQIKYVKESKGGSVIRTKRIDIFVAWVMARARSKFYDTGASVYEKRGLIGL